MRSRSESTLAKCKIERDAPNVLRTLSRTPHALPVEDYWRYAYAATLPIGAVPVDLCKSVVEGESDEQESSSVAMESTRKPTVVDLDDSPSALCRRARRTRVSRRKLLRRPLAESVVAGKSFFHVSSGLVCRGRSHRGCGLGFHLSIKAACAVA